MISHIWTEDIEADINLRLNCKGTEGRVEGAKCDLCDSFHIMTFEFAEKHFIKKQKVRDAIATVCLHPDSSADLKKELGL